MYVMTDGRVIVGRRLAEDDLSYTVKSPEGPVRLPKEQVASVQRVRADHPRDIPRLDEIKPPWSLGQQMAIVGGSVLAVTWFSTSVAAGISDKKGSNLGFIPVVGPLLWVNEDSQEQSGIGFAILSTAVQGAGLLSLTLSSFADNKEPVGKGYSKKWWGARLFWGAGAGLVATWSVTALTASIVREAADDDTALWGLLPVAGPIIWVSRASHSRRRDGGWAPAVMSSVVQGLAVVGMTIGGLQWLFDSDESSSTRLTFAPMGGPTTAGLVVLGHF